MPTRPLVRTVTPAVQRMCQKPATTPAAAHSWATTLGSSGNGYAGTTQGTWVPQAPELRVGALVSGHRTREA
jgi:hypothetical protein